jgi:hypothetical protein
MITVYSQVGDSHNNYSMLSNVQGTWLMITTVHTVDQHFLILY